jgi:pyridoxal 5'-phosphate synthase pdxS subunit
VFDDILSHARAVQREIRKIQTMDEDELYSYAKEIQAPVELVKKTKELGRLPVVNFAAGGIVRSLLCNLRI